MVGYVFFFFSHDDYPRFPTPNPTWGADQTSPQAEVTICWSFPSLTEELRLGEVMCKNCLGWELPTLKFSSFLLKYNYSGAFEVFWWFLVVHSLKHFGCKLSFTSMNKNRPPKLIEPWDLKRVRFDFLGCVQHVAAWIPNRSAWNKRKKLVSHSAVAGSVEDTAGFCSFQRPHRIIDWTWNHETCYKENRVFSTARRIKWNQMKDIFLSVFMPIRMRESAREPFKPRRSYLLCQYCWPTPGPSPPHDEPLKYLSKIGAGAGVTMRLLRKGMGITEQDWEATKKKWDGGPWCFSQFIWL